MATKKRDKHDRKDHPEKPSNLPGEAAQVAGYTRDEGFGNRGGGSGEQRGGVGTLPVAGAPGESPSPTGEAGADHPS
jgi:hypothetical protein